jgi:sugar phosphate isomerase/epimerase
MKIGCETYVWEMLPSSQWPTPGQLLDYVAEAGCDGIEFTPSMLREFYDQPEMFKKELARRNLEFCGLAFGTSSGFTDPEQRAADLDVAKRAINYLEHFPGAQLEPGTASSPTPQSNWQRKVDNAIKFYNELAKIAGQSGITVCVHPNSTENSLLKTADQYRYLMDKLDPDVKYCPDSGHIVRGGQDLLACFTEYAPRISHVHLKDADARGNWRLTGEGICDFQGVLRLLERIGYRGWIVLEDESDEARRDGRAAIRHGREYFKKLGY